ncbi:hypothetical protein E2C01_062377 [Portunus trituberculatus]|uniref:Uncharacterized protein n=1 Tax=Portunus trituberculatus TaxID=210409 RepID=A0A5B7HEH9_PORTR|nr:hypothetical protein [Portunus trituberculatus]
MTRQRRKHGKSRRITKGEEKGKPLSLAPRSPPLYNFPSCILPSFVSPSRAFTSSFTSFGPFLTISLRLSKEEAKGVE